MLVISIMVVFGAGFLSYNERLVIADISVQGANSLRPETVKAAALSSLHDGKYHLFARSNIFLYPKSEIVDALKTELPRIKSVGISRESLLAQAVIVSLEERYPQYTWCEAERCFLMDEDGYIFAEANGEETAYTFRGGLIPTQAPIGQTFLRGHFKDVVELLSLLQGAGHAPVSVTVENEKDMSIFLQSGFYLKVAFASEASEVVKNLELILASDALRGNLDTLEYVDLRFGNRVYYQMK
jgi:cell division septal protein FtsQ